MIKPISPSRPVDVLRQSSDQIRRAAALLAELTDETAPAAEDRYPARQLQLPREEPDEALLARDATIRKAQRSFVAGLRLAQHRDRATD